MTEREELRLKILEEDVRHEQAISKLRGERLDAHDTSIEGLKDLMGELTVNVVKLQEETAKTQAMLQSLIQIIAAEHSNGGGKA